MDDLELFVVLEGRVRVRCEAVERDLGLGASALIPRGSAHAFKGLGPGPSRLLVTLVPGTNAALFRRAVEGLRLPRDMASVAEVAGAHGMESSARRWIEPAHRTRAPREHRRRPRGSPPRVPAVGSPDLVPLQR